MESLDKPQLIKAVLAAYEHIDTQGLRNSGMFQFTEFSKFVIVTKCYSNDSIAADTQSTKESDDKCRQQLVEATKRETMLLKTLTEKEREISDLAVSFHALTEWMTLFSN